MFESTAGTPPSPEGLRALGVLTPAMLAESVKQAPPSFVLDGLIAEKSVNLVVGDSGLGKTPWLLGLAVAVAAGVPYMGRAVSQGPVIYGDAEMPKDSFMQLLSTLSGHLGLAAPPENVFAYSLNFGPTDNLDYKAALRTQIGALKPKLVIVDPLRGFFQGADAKSELAESTIRFQRQLAKSCGAAWINLHHRRKVNTQAPERPDLLSDPRSWFAESAGSFALVNHTDLRLGIERGSGEADIVLGGFARGSGPLAPIRLARDYNDAGDPVGYRVITGVSLLSPEEQGAFNALLPSFTFTQAQQALGTSSGSKTTAFLDACRAAGLIRKEDVGKRTSYSKVM